MSNIIKSEEQIKARVEQFLNDEYRRNLLERLHRIHTRIIPQYILTDKGLEQLPIDDPRYLYAESKLREYDQLTYPDIVNQTHKG